MRQHERRPSPQVLAPRGGSAHSGGRLASPVPSPFLPAAELPIGYLSILLLGGLVGMQHALEADHLAAIAALSAGKNTRRGLVLRGTLWGMGHTFTLFLFCGLVFVLGLSIPDRTQSFLELLVGLMIIGLGGQVLYRLRRDRRHVHVHEHAPGVRHVHVHSHRDEPAPHADSDHAHAHEHLGLRKAPLVGMVHGAAGSGGLLVLTAATGSAVGSMGYVLVFGLGSIAGMAALSFIASFPLDLIGKSAAWVNNLAMGAIGCVAVAIGAVIFAENWSALF